MKCTAATVLAVALTHLPQPVLAAEGSAEDAVQKQPTMVELAAKIDSLGTRLGALAGAVGTLADTLGKPNASTGCSAASPCGLWGRVENLTAKVDSHASRRPEIAVVMTVPTSCPPRDSGALRCAHKMYLMAGSTIAGFPTRVGTYHQFTDTTLPTGTYLFELQQPYSDNLVCQGTSSRRVESGVAAADGGLPALRCPRLYLAGAGEILHDGAAIWRLNEHHRSFRAMHRFPNAFAFTDDNPVTSYAGSIKITKLK